MYQIFDCLGKPVGRPQGYAKHSTAEGLITRPSAIRRAIFDAFEQARIESRKVKSIWAIRWIEGANHE